MSLLVQTLQRKVQQGQPVVFDYEGQLVRLVDQVTAEIAQINRLFPEYTPHDALYHINRLFDVADRVLENSRYGQLNAAELFILAAGLYAHDWGMAIGDSEREALRAWISEQNIPPALATLPSENERIQSFAQSAGVVWEAIFDDIGLWREYVRQTHAERSAQRCRAFFRAEGGGVGEAIARVCWAHGVGFEELERPGTLPSDFAVKGYTVNLLAIAVYVRLIDLLDLADDRTPFAVWQFVAPRSPKSAMEWKKHRSLNPVTCPSYQGSRKILVDGSTNDSEVWAELQDLGRYVSEQVRASNDLLARLPDRRCYLDLPIVDWRIHAEGFLPIDLRFEFDRERTFDLLSEEIYEGDPYVFLRELLQNSIDAIKMRKELLERDGTSIEGLICFQIDHSDPKITVVRCQDNGIGMDDYVIRHYLSVAGRSFYSSEDFHRYGLKMDAISRFGIGILSCFIAANEIQIETLRDPAIAGKRAPLCIHVPDVTKQFRVFPGSASLKPGTTVTVRALTSRFSTSPSGWNDCLHAAEYLSRVAGFVDFPILVKEGVKNTLILHPDADQHNALAVVCRAHPDLNADSIVIKKKAQTYPWEHVFAAQDLARAKELLSLKWIDLARVSAESDASYEARVAILSPRDERSLCSSRDDPNDGFQTVVIKSPLSGEMVTEDIRWLSERSIKRTTSPLPRSLCQNPQLEIHYNGIAVSDDPSREPERPFLQEEYDLFPLPYCSINIRKSVTTVLNVARSRVRSGTVRWQEDLRTAVFDRLLADETRDLAGLSDTEHFLKVGQLINYYNTPIHQLFEHVAPHSCCCVWFDARRQFAIQKISQRFPDEIAGIPFGLGTNVGFDLRAKLGRRNWTVGVPGWLLNWAGEAFYVQEAHFLPTDDVTGGLEVAARVLEDERPVLNVRFLKGFRFDGDIIAQPVYRKLGSAPAPDSTGDRILTNDKVEDDEWSVFVQTLDLTELFGSYHPFKFGLFEPPFEDRVACGCAVLNIGHCVTQTSFRLALLARYHPMRKGLDAVKRGRLDDLRRNLWNCFSDHRRFIPEEFSKAFELLSLELAYYELWDHSLLPRAPEYSDFVPESLRKTETGFLLIGEPSWHGESPPEAEYGQRIANV